MVEGEAESVATGVDASRLMLMEVVEKQPVVVLVTVTEYTPDAFTTAVLPLWLTTPGPAKLYALPPPAVRVKLVWAQVRVVDGLADSIATGVDASRLMVMLVTLKQPLTVLVTVTEYTPDAFTTAMLPLWETTPGPLKA